MARALDGERRRPGEAHGRRTMSRTLLASPLVLAVALSGCASTLSGVGGTDGYACKAPEGAMCTSVSGVYANSRQGMPPRPKPWETKPSVTPASYGASRAATAKTSAVPSAAIRSNPRLLRLWIAPWEDTDGDLHEEALVHVVVDTGRWLIEHVRPARRSRIDGVAPPIATPQDAPAAKPANETAPAPARFPIPPGGLSSGAESQSPER
jgi:conjugal transfer pilus assembly protein TraV